MRRGKFGDIAIYDTQGIRELCIDDQCQGSAYLNPSSNIVDASLPFGPGPISHSPYHYGWLLAGVHYPQGSGLMIGLGSGAGAIQLLYEFPDIDLTVVEIDPAMTAEALRGFPLLNYYQDLGRLRIVHQDALVFLMEALDRYDFGLADAYSGSTEAVSHYYDSLMGVCDAIYLNVIDKANGPSLRKAIYNIVNNDRPLTALYRPLPLELLRHPMHALANWIIVSSSSPRVGMEEDYTPFEELVHATADKARSIYERMLAEQPEIEDVVDIVV
jgi:hypothetical protein